jgi:regulatory protein
MTEKQAIPKIAAYCSKAERCSSEIRKKLFAWELSDEAISRILAMLRAEDFLNEERYVRCFVKDKMRFNKWGKNKIVFELRKKLVPDGIIHAVFDEVTDNSVFEESLENIIQKKIKAMRAANPCEKRAKLFRFAAGRGFQPDMIVRCLDKLLKNEAGEEYFV